MTSSRQAKVRAVVGAFFAVELVWAACSFGATEVHSQYRLFLLVLIPALIAVLGLSLTSFQELRFVPFVVVGLFLLVNVVLRPSFLGRGYVVASLGWLALFLTMVLTAGSQRAARALLFVLIIIGSIEALYGLVQSVGGVDYIGEYYRGWGRRATGTLINPNHFAGLLNMIIPLTVGALFAAFSRKGDIERIRSEVYAWAWIILLACSLMGLVVFLSLSRAGTLSLIGSLMLITLMLALGRKKGLGRNLPATAAWVLLFTATGLACWIGLDAILDRFAQVEVDRTGRTTVYRQTLRLIRDNPLFGVGPGMYVWRFRPYQTLDADTLWEQAHNDYLQSAAEWGIAAALLFWGFVLWRLYRSVRVFFQSADRWRQGIALGSSAAIFATLLHSFVDFNLQIPANLMVFCIVLGLSWSLERQQAPQTVALRCLA